MKNILAFGGVFLAGAIVGQIAGGLLLRNLVESSPTARFGVSDEYVTGQFGKMCGYLADRNCSCEPVVFTESACRAYVDEFLIQ